MQNNIYKEARCTHHNAYYFISIFLINMTCIFEELTTELHLIKFYNILDSPRFSLLREYENTDHMNFK